MADVFAVFGTLLALGIAFPGLLLTFRLLFPQPVKTAQVRLAETPWLCFWMGLLFIVLAGMPIFLLLALPFGPTQLFGAILIFLVLCFGAIGAAGIAAVMALRIAGSEPEGETSAGTFVKAAVALELAAAFPIIGWFVILPLALVTSLGASTFAIFHWRPRKHATVASQPAVSPQT